MTQANLNLPARTFSGDVPFLGRVRIRNYKSIGKCDIELGALTILVGRNGSGKSNFFDALRFIVDGLQSSLDHAIKLRGGIDSVRRRSTGHPRNFAIELDMNLDQGKSATYGFEVAARPQGGFVVKEERLRVKGQFGESLAHYAIKEATLIEQSLVSMPPAVSDRLYLVNAAGLPDFRGVYDALSSMGFYNLNPEAMRELKSPDSGELLHRDGGNIPSVIGRLAIDKPEVLERVKLYLDKVMPGITEVNRVTLGPRESLEFRQRVAGSSHPWRFYATSMSDGTLRALGILIAATQLAGHKHPVSLVGIEEPETSLHPATTGTLIDAIREAAAHTQVLVTSHSPDLLDQIDPATDMLLSVISDNGDTRIAPLDAASRDAIRKHLYSPGELLRMDQLEPDRQNLEKQEQMTLFNITEDEA